MLTDIQRAYIDWKALGGIITDDDGPHKLTLVELGELLRPQQPIDKSQLSRSCQNVPNFWDLVAERRKFFNSTSRIAYLHERWYVAAATMKNWALTEAYLRNFDPTYKEPKAKQTEDLSNAFADLVSNMVDKKRIQQSQPIEGEVVQKEGQ